MAKIAKFGGVLFACLMNCSFVHATTVYYDIELRVDSILKSGNCNASVPGESTFGCISIGDIFHGSFGVDSSFLSTDGIVNTAPILDFKLAFGQAFYSTGPDNLTLFGFRNPQIGAQAPGFVIEGGQVVDFYGGVYGGGDVPFIDMYGASNLAGRNRFAASDGSTYALGNLLINPIPEPSSLILLGLALGALTGARFRRAQPLATD